MSAAAIGEIIQQYLADKLGVAPEAILPSERFRRLGVDSLMATAMLVMLGKHLGRPLSPTLAWQFPTPSDLARHLAGESVETSEAALDVLPVASDEPIAIVGMACRFPGAADPDAFWALLRDGVDAVREVPEDRWDTDALFDADVATPGKMSTRWAGLLDDVASFDAAFFGISPREATQIDPQQRLMLELSWEAIEDAGLVASALKGTRTGVFFGAMWMDYSRLPGATADRIGPHTATGQDLSIIPARVSYTLGLIGPSLAVNTACSSSLVAVHLARQSLLRGESRLALAGGVNLLISPESTIEMSKFGAMAPDGRSKAFDARANGYVRGEGGGVIVLKRLSDAIADGDHVYCTIRGSALNNDGFSNGLTAPSPQAQEAVIRDACADAGVPPSEVQYVEAHGTGTMLGDPIEAGALGAALGRGRPADRPLRIGSVKTNVGHLEAAAGMAGLIKVVLSMIHRQLPATLHYRQPNPHIDFERLRLRVQDALEPWAAESGRRVAGVSSFGFGGTNAHVVLEGTTEGAVRSVRLAAPTAQKLVADAKALAQALRASPFSLETIAEPTHVEGKIHRLAVAARSAEEVASQLEGFVIGRPLPGLAHGTAPASRPRVVLVFGGQGSQWLGMGRALLREDAAGRAALTRCDAALHGFAEWSLVERLQRGDAKLLDDTAFVQPAIFAMQVALTEALRARGLEIDAVVGQSMGEVAAAHVAGALSLEDAARVICVRSALVGEVRGGRMAVVGLSLAAATEVVASYGDRLSIAVAAGPDSTVVAGEQDAVEALRAQLEPRGVVVRDIRVDYASHSRFMDPLLPALRERLAPVRPRACAVAFWSTVTGGPLPGGSLDAAYWARNLREPVLFAPTLERLAAERAAVFVEVDPHPVLAQFVEQCLTSTRGAAAVVVPCAARDEAETQTVAEAVGRLFVLGAGLRSEGAPSRARSAELVVLSAKTPQALSGLAGRLREHLDGHPDLALGDLAYSLLATRSSMSRRLALTVPSREALRDALQAAASGEMLQEPPDVSSEVPPKTVFVFPGQGSQWLGMGRQLLAEEPAFREALSACDRAIAAEAGWSVLDELAAPAESSKLDRIEVVQPVLFAIEVALATLWRAGGIEPHAVVGHSMGEVAAACVAGALSLEDGAAVICRRSALLSRVSGQGEMALVELSIDQANAELKGFEDRLGVAVSNSRRSTVLSGDPGALASVLERLEKRGVFCRRVKVDVASHSPQMDPLVGELVAKLHGLAPRAAQVPMRSTVTGAVLKGPELKPSYWADNLRQPVRFGRAVESLLSEGFTLFVEMSPHPILVPAIEENRQAAQAAGVAVGSLRREQPERATMLESLGALHVHGHPLDPERLFPGGRRRVSLPTYAWQRERYWLPPAPAERSGGKATGHPLLGSRIPAAGADAVYECVLSASQPPWLSDHRVGDRVFVPGAALAELVRAAADDHSGGRAPQVTGLVLQAPLALAERETKRVQVVLTDAGARAALYGQAADAAPGAPWVQHVSADVSPASSEKAPAALDLTAIRARCRESVDVTSVYAGLVSIGLHHGPAFQGLRALWRGPREALAEVELAEGLDADGYGLHPALLDAALQTTFGALEGPAGGTMLPFELGRLVVHRPGATAALVHVRLESQTADGFTADLRLADASGEIIAEVGQFRARRAEGGVLEGRAPDAAPDAFYRLEWPAVEAPERKPATRRRWAVVSNGDTARQSKLVEELRDRGAHAEALEISRLGQATRVDHVVCVWSSEGAADEAMRMATAGLAVVQALVKAKAPPRLWWVTTHGVSAASGDRVALPPSAAWGLGRTVMQEHPELGCTLIDVEQEAQIAETLVRELAAGDGENQVAWRGGRRHVARLARAPATPSTPASANYRLATKRAGTLDGLGPVAATRIAPGPDQVEIEVRASGINFRDVLSALGMYPGAPMPLGAECAGIVVRTGASVESVRAGDRVMALATGAFGRFVTIDSRWVAPAPAGLTFEQAATIPVVFLTAWYALHELAGLQRGERVLIHAAAGGVGMAAVQIARWIGAEVLATASPPKWDAVRAMGVQHVASSRDPSFARAFRASGGGADVVLNSLTGELIDASLSLLSAGGRFIEMGKTDVRDPAKVAAAHPGVVYRVFDLFEVDPEKIAAMFLAVTEGFAAGHLQPLPVRAFPMSEAEDAFRFMAQAKHVGKLALLPVRDVLRTDGTVLITGGLGALGLEVARDMADRGVPHLVLLGRRGLDTPGAAEAVAALEGRGARVTVAAVDAAVREALATAIHAIPPELPLRAVVHAAGLIDDGLLAAQTPERFRGVMAPKVQGAWNLHTLTANADLDAFVLFSSIAGTLGNGGQGAYAAANVFLDALAAERRARGLAGASLAWGPWAERGLAAGLDVRHRGHVAEHGFGSLSPDQGRSLFAAALARPEAQLVIAPLDLRAVAKDFGPTVPPVWRGLVRAAPARAAATNGARPRDLAAIPADKRADAMVDAVRAEIARVMSLGRAGAVPLDKPLRELGLDSLMAVELRNALGRRVGRALPATLAFDYPTAAAIAKYLLGEPSSPKSPESERSPTGAAPLSVPVARAEPVRALLRRADRIERIPMGLRWITDAFRVIPSAGGFAQRAVDVGRATEAVQVLSAAGVRATLVHVMIRAAALALGRNPQLHQLVCGYRRLTPGSVDIGLSMAGQTTYAPVVVLPAVERKPLGELVPTIEAALVAAREKERVDLDNLRRVGWMTPIGWLRRLSIRVMQSMFWYRRKLVGTFQVSSVPTADAAVPLQFYSGSILSFGRPRDSVVVVDGKASVRPMLVLSVCTDQAAMDGLRAAALLDEIVKIVESDELVDEARASAPAPQPPRLESAPGVIRALPEATLPAASQD
jgi:acyl transferase domain-containing protein/D-arabinose 1-dehydrogenase-like Zn-dependent alcohol dehydrogenase/acyl carrier protein/NADP-dependent 3-hydroxy acid dehydrogenase YdfG